MPEESQRDDIAALASDLALHGQHRNLRELQSRSTRTTNRRPTTCASANGQQLAGGQRVTIRATPFAEVLNGTTGQAQIGNARNRFGQWLVQVGIDDESAEELLIVFSELAANAVAASAPGTLARLRAHREETNVVLEAVNGSPETIPRDGGAWDLADPLRPGGRGLLIVDEYMDNVQVEPADDLNGILVRCRRSLIA